MGEASVSKAAEKAGISRTTVYNFIGKLASKNLLGKKVINNRRYYYPNNEKLSFLDMPVSGEENENKFILFNNFVTTQVPP